MKFSEFEYKRPDINELQTKFNDLLEIFDSAESVEIQEAIIKDINNLRSEFWTQGSIARIRYSIDTTDKEYETEQDFFDEVEPLFEGITTRYYNSLIKSRFKKLLEEKFGKQLFDIADVVVKTFKDEIVEDLKEENQLRTEYSKLLASARIMFEGEERNLAGLTPFTQDMSRDMRRNANNAKWSFFSDNEEQLNRIFDDLVKTRHSMAVKLGYKNFVQMGYNRMGRTDYNSEMVAKFRKKVQQYIVPIAARLKEKQRQRLGLDSMKYYDQPIDYKTGNAKPHGEPEWIVSCAVNMYNELSPETAEFFKFMNDNELMDLVNKKGKEGGGFCAFIEKYKSPFIFSNFNGTAGDVVVLTHEAGHAFQAYASRNYEIPEYYSPTAEACEIHSMSMEFLTWPWMNCFFKEQTDKFKYSHLKDSLISLPYGVSVDEFQHFVYENPSATPKERKQAWLDIEKKYLPYIDYDDNEFLKQGGRWQQQLHIYLIPFYYIDYCLAQICAFQFWKKSHDDRDKAIADYMRLCKAGGSMSFLDLVKLADLKSPFEDGCIESFVGDIEKWLDSADDNLN